MLPFPGMDPYLETPNLWPDVHNSLALALRTSLPDAPYVIILSRAERRPEVEIWSLSLREPLPIVPIPLQSADPDIPLDATEALRRIYRNARYDLRIDYRAVPPPPARSPADAAWRDAHLQCSQPAFKDMK